MWKEHKDWSQNQRCLKLRSLNTPMWSYFMSIFCNDYSADFNDRHRRGETGQDRTGQDSVTHPCWLPKVSSLRVNQVCVPVACSICASCIATNGTGGYRGKMGITLQPENENVSASTRGLYKDWHVIIPAEQNSCFSHILLVPTKDFEARFMPAWDCYFWKPKKSWLFSP